MGSEMCIRDSLQTGSLLLPVLLHAAIDLRFLLVPSRVLPAGRAAA